MATKADFCKTWKVVDHEGMTDVDDGAVFSITDAGGDSVNCSFPIRPPSPSPAFGAAYTGPLTGTYDSASEKVSLPGNVTLSLLTLSLLHAEVGTVESMLSGEWAEPEAGEWDAEAEPQTL